MKRAQNKVAESRFALPVMLLYGTGVWMLCGLVQQQWWVQFGCFIASVLLMVLLNNVNLLIRTYSQMVSSAFIALTCMAPFLFPSTDDAIGQVCIIASLYTFYRCYQDRASTGMTFYTFLFLGLGSTLNVYILYLLPFYWIMMLLFIYSFSWRTFSTSIIGLLLPYWFLTAWVLNMEEGNFSPWIEHFRKLAYPGTPFDYTVLGVSQWLVFFVIILISMTGIIHYLRTSYQDKIRVRQIYYSFFFIQLVAMLILLVFPQQYNLMIRVMIIMASPLIAHFITLTKTRITNIAFFVLLSMFILLTLNNIWISSSHF